MNERSVAIDSKYPSYGVKEETNMNIRNDSSTEYKLYSSRWGVFITVLMFNLSNNGLWICIGAVSTKAAEFYEQDIAAIDLLSSIFLYVGIPTCFALTWINNKIGLRKTMGAGITLTFLCGVVRLLTFIPNIGKNEQYWMIFASQIFNGIGNPMAVAIATKVSQNWFAGAQQIFVTVALSFSPLLGTMIGQAITPALVAENAENFSKVNWVFPIFSTITMIMFIFFVRSDLPPTPPSRSAEIGQDKLPYLKSMRMLLTNASYVVLTVVLGAGLGFFNALATQMQQFACSRGYTDEFAGLSVTFMIIAGFFGSILVGAIVVRTGKLEEAMKISGAVACLFGFLIAQLLRKPDIEWAIYIAMALFGTFSFAYYTIGLEFNVELTYPVDQVSGMAIIFAIGQIQAAFFIIISGALETPLPPDAKEKSNCGDTEGKDHTHFMVFLCIYLSVIITVLMIFVKTAYKRRLANRVQENKRDN